MAHKVTLKEIASEVGLSVTSVSLVLNNRPCKISEESRRRIREVAKRKRYIPNQIARSLVTRRSRTLGLVVPNIESRFFSALARHLELLCRAEGYALFITNSDDSPQNDADLVASLVNRGVDGLFLVVSDERPETSTLAGVLSAVPVPCIMVDRSLEGAPGDRVRFANETGGYLACRCLLDHGHRRIACLANTRSATGQERLAGYRRALDEALVPFDPSLVLESAYYIQSAYEASAPIADLGATAAFASSDNIALGLLKRLFEQGLRVPEDLSVVSYDNHIADVLFATALTSVEQDVGLLSERALDLMLLRIGEADRGEEAADYEDVRLDPRLVEKDSVLTLA